jgi:ABC-2 type transport system permease protein
MFERIRHMLIKEFIQLFRDPRMKSVIFVVPAVQTIVFGYAATTDVRRIRTAIYDLDNSVESRALVDQFTSGQYFEVVTRVANDREAQSLLDHSTVQVVLRINHGFGADIDAGRTAPLQLLLDGTDSNTAGIILNYSGQITRQFSQNILTVRADRLVGTARQPGGVELASRAWFNDNLESRNFYVPGVIANIILIITLLLTSMAVVREKEIGTMEQVMVTPITPVEFILGKTLPFAVVAFVDVVLVTTVGVFWFDVPIRGNLFWLFFSTGLYLLSTLGVGLFISTISQTQQQAMMTTFFYIFPAILLSGFAFPIANMPKLIQYITYLNPLRYFLIILRGIFLKGVGLEILWPQILSLALLGLATLWLAVKRFHKTLA